MVWLRLKEVRKKCILAEKKAKGVLKEAKEQSSEIVNLAQKRANELWKNQKILPKKKVIV